MAQKLKIDIVAKDRSKRALQGLQGSLARLKNSVFSLQSAFIGLGAGLAIRNIVNTGKQIENLQVQLKFLFGSAKEGAKAFDEMAKFASKVPFSLEEIQRGSGVLAVVSDDAEELANLMKITGNVASVTGLDFKTTAEQIQRSLSAGISAADLFRDKGVKDMLGFKAGATVSVEETVAAFERVFGSGGRFDGATDELAKTLGGTLSMIGDKVFNFKRVLLDAGFFAQLKQQFGDLNKSLAKNSETMDKIAVTIGTLLAMAVEKVANGFKLLAKYSSEVGTAFKIIVSLKIGFMLVRWARALIPIVASLRAIAAISLVGLAGVAASVAAATGTFILLGKELDKIEEKINKNNEAFKEQKKIVTNMYRGGGADVMAVAEPVKKMHEILMEMNEKTITDIKKKFEDIRTTIAKGINSGITKVSEGLARAVILGEKLADTFKNMVQNVLVKLLSALIELGIRIAMDVSWQLIKETVLKRQTNELRQQNSLLKKQMALKAVTSLFGGFFASGGAVSKGKPVVVGERGPELFVPNQTGQITQNARGTGGGGSTNVNFNITTLDARGFDQMLVQNRGTITQIINQAVNERGSKNLI
jgi:hypothetical protein